MANPAVTHLAAGDATDTANNTNITSGSVSPTGDALLCVAYAGNGGHTISSFSTTLSTSGSWYGPYTVDQGTQTVAIGFIKLASTPGTGTVSATLSSKTNRKAICLAEATGYDTTTPLLNTTSNTATGSSTNPSVTLTAVDTGNTTFGGVCAANSPTPDQGSELTEVGGAGGVPYLSAAYDDTSPGNTFSWTMTTGAWAVAAIEIQAAPEAGLTKSFTDDLDAWNDNANLILEHEIAKADTNAANWLDGTDQDLGSAALEEAVGSNLANWNDDSFEVQSFELSKTDDLDNWSDSSLTFSLNFNITAAELSVWMHDSLQTEDTRNLTETFSDDLDNWNDSVSVLVGFAIPKTDDLDNWSDFTTTVYFDYLLNVWATLGDLTDSVSTDLAAAEGGALTKTAGDDLDNWNDGIALFFTYALEKSDDLDNWNDSFDRDLSYLIAKADDLDNWNDSFTRTLGDLISKTDDLDNWNDSVDRLFAYLMDQSDDLDNWNDSFQREFAYFITKTDDLDNWADSVALGRVLFLADDLDNWLDEILAYRSAELAFADNIRGPPFPDPADDISLLLSLLIQKSDTLSLSDSYDRVLGLHLSFADDLDNWLDNRAYDLGGEAALIERSFADTLTLSDSFVKRRFDYLLTRTDDLDNWNDSFTKFLLGSLSYAFNDDAANWADQLGRGHGQLHSDSFTLTEAIALLLGYLKAIDDNLANWNDSVAKQLVELLLRTFSDDLNNWDESVTRDLLHRIPKTDALSMDDGIERFGQLLISKFDTLTLSDYEQLILNYWKSFSDSMTLTDGFQKFLEEPDLKWQPSDTLTMSDAIEKFMQIFLAKSDSMTLTDAVSIAAILTNQSSDTLSLSDAYSRILAHLIAKSDTLSMSDTRQVLVGHLLALSDSFTLTDADAHVIGQLLAYSDSLTLTDSQDLLLHLRKSLSDTLSMSDDLETLLAYLLQLSDTLSMADGFAKEIGGIAVGERAVSSVMTLSDSTERLLNHFLNRSDTLVLSDGLQLLLSLLLANVNDDLNNWADNLLRTQGLNLQQSDDFTLSDASLLILGHILRKSDALSPSDGLAMLLAYYLSVSEVMALSDASRLINGYLKAISDDADNWQDSLVRVLGLNIAAGSDLDAWAQAIALEISRWLSLGDGLTLVDGTARFAQFLLTRSDTLTMSDILTKAYGYLLSLTDSLNSWADKATVFAATIGGLYLTKVSDLDAWLDAVVATLGTVATIIKFGNEAFSEPLMTSESITEVALSSESLTEVALEDSDFDASE